MTRTTAKARAWCLHCPDLIHPGDDVIVDEAYAKPGSSRQPMIHARCEDAGPYDPDQE